MTIIDMVDEIAAIVEPNPDLRDRSRAMPHGGSEWVPGRLYAWSDTETFQRPVTGPQDELHIRIRLAWVVDDANAQAGGDMDPDVSAAIATKIEAVRSAILAAALAICEDAHLDSIEPLTTNSVRGAYMNVSAYSLGP